MIAALNQPLLLKQNLRKNRQCQTKARTQQQPQSPTKYDLVLKGVESILSIPFVFNAAKKNARQQIIDRYNGLGFDWEKEVRELQQADLESIKAELENGSIEYPDYYLKPFHAYEKGNLSWQCAQEFNQAAISVHANLFPSEEAELSRDGDALLRQSYSSCMLTLLENFNIDKRTIERITDIGSATGLSSLELLRIFPKAHVSAIDLSPYFISVGKYQQQIRQREILDDKENIDFIHAKGEQMPLENESMDLVSICLAVHELPNLATWSILEEAMRVVRPGGVLAVMDMNPKADSWLRVLNNPFAFAAFKSTEPWLQEYITFDFENAFGEIGFRKWGQLENSPRHRTLVAVK